MDKIFCRKFQVKNHKFNKLTRYNYSNDVNIWYISQRKLFVMKMSIPYTVFFSLASSSTQINKYLIYSVKVLKRDLAIFFRNSICFRPWNPKTSLQKAFFEILNRFYLIWPIILQKKSWKKNFFKKFAEVSSLEKGEKVFTEKLKF